MPDIKDRKVEIVRVVPPDGQTIQETVTTKKLSGAERVEDVETITSFSAHSCGCHKKAGFTCTCGRSYCSECVGRAARYCKECGITLCVNCKEEMHDGTVYCDQHVRWLDWSGPIGQAIVALIVLVSLASFTYFLFRYVD